VHVSNGIGLGHALLRITDESDGERSRRSR
jgi:hypothetical protein